MNPIEISSDSESDGEPKKTELTVPEKDEYGADPIKISDDEDQLKLLVPIIAEVHSISEDVRKNQEVIAKLEETKKKLEFELIRLGAKEVASAKNLEMVSKRMDKMKQRVHDISKKISELSGTPENYQKSISFKHTAYPEFNKKVKKLMNCKDSAPDSQDILEALVDCNKKFNYNLRTNHMKQIASMSFQKVSLKLRKRRELELKEDLSVFDTNEEDPAIVDAELLAKLNDNKRIGELNLIKLFAPRPEDVPKPENESPNTLEITDLSTEDDVHMISD